MSNLDCAEDEEERCTEDGGEGGKEDAEGIDLHFEPAELEDFDDQNQERVIEEGDLEDINAWARGDYRDSAGKYDRENDESPQQQHRSNMGHGLICELEEHAKGAISALKKDPKQHGGYFSIKLVAVGLSSDLFWNQMAYLSLRPSSSI